MIDVVTAVLGTDEESEDVIYECRRCGTNTGGRGRCPHCGRRDIATFEL